MIAAPVKSLLNRARYALLPGAQVGINRIRHDREFNGVRGPGRYPYLSRFYGLNRPGLPETVRYTGGKKTVHLSDAWVGHFLEINAEHPEAIAHLKKLQSGWVNYGPFPTVEQLGFGGDYVVVTHIVGNRAYINSYDNSLSPSNYKEDYNQAFHIVYPDDSIGSPDWGPAYTFVIANHGENLWIDVGNLTFIRKE